RLRRRAAGGADDGPLGRTGLDWSGVRSAGCLSCAGVQTAHFLLGATGDVRATWRADAALLAAHDRRGHPRHDVLSAGAARGRRAAAAADLWFGPRDHS